MRLKAKISERIYDVSTGEYGEQYITKDKIYNVYYYRGKTQFAIDDDRDSMHPIGNCEDEVIIQDNWFKERFDIMI